MNRTISAGARRSLLLYNAVFPLVLAAMLPALLGRMFRRGNFRHKFAQRFARFAPEVRQRLAGGEWTWIHSISVGETMLALKLAGKMRERDPALRVVLSVTTSTGLVLAEEAALPWMEVIYNPVDGLPFVRAALGAVRPRRLIFIEAIWPNLLIEAKKRGIPVALIPRLSPRSERRFRRAQKWTGPIFSELDLIAAPEAEDRTRWASLGAQPKRIRITGNIKFDHTPGSSPRTAEFRGLLRKLGVNDTSPILLAGSTFPGEERLVGEVFRELRATHPDLFLIVVPRHVERTSEVAADLTSAGLSFALRTAGGAHPADSLIVNTTGELRDWYSLATVVFIGKSLTSTGGQNPVEAVMAGKPVLFGPHMENFQPITAQWLAAGAAVEVRDATELKAQLADLLNDPTRREQLATRAKEIASRHAGATTRAAELLLDL